MKKIKVGDAQCPYQIAKGCDLTNESKLKTVHSMFQSKARHYMFNVHLGT